jgi:hypothetical protein
MYQLPAAGLALSLIVFSSASNFGAEADGVVDVFLTRAEPRLESYEAHRTLVGWSEGSDREGSLHVITEFDRAARMLRYTILAEAGSGIVRRRGLEGVLRAEIEAVKEGRMAQSALTAQNYKFSPPVAEDTGLYRLLIRPQRKDSLLVDGAMFVTGDGDLVRVEGQLAKNPSFWTTRVEVAREYARIAGITMLVRVQSTVKTRLFGTGRFLMTYRYRHVNGQQVEDAPESTARR